MTSCSDGDDDDTTPAPTTETEQTPTPTTEDPEQAAAATATENTVKGTYTYTDEDGENTIVAVDGKIVQIGSATDNAVTRTNARLCGTYTVASDGTVTGTFGGDDFTATTDETAHRLKTITIGTGAEAETIAVTYASADTEYTVIVDTYDVYDFVNLTAGENYDSANNTITNVTSSINATTALGFSGVYFQSSYGIKLTGSGTVTIPTTGRDTTVIVYVVQENGSDKKLTLSDGGDYSVDRNLVARGIGRSVLNNLKNNPQAFVWRYTGTAKSLTLTSSGETYIGKLLVNNEVLAETQALSKFDLTEENTSFVYESDGSSKYLSLYNVSSGGYPASSDQYLAQYGIKYQGEDDYVFNALAGAVITIESYNAKPQYALYDVDGSVLVDVTPASVPSDASNNAVVINVPNTCSGIVILTIKTGGYSKYIQVAPAE